MLLRMLRSLARGGSDGEPRAGDDALHTTAGRLANAYAAAPIETHLAIAYGDVRIGEHDLLTFVQRCLVDSDTSVIRHKVLHRPLALRMLRESDPDRLRVLLDRMNS